MNNPHTHTSAARAGTLHFDLLEEVARINASRPDDFYAESASARNRLARVRLAYEQMSRDDLAAAGESFRQATLRHLNSMCESVHPRRTAVLGALDPDQIAVLFQRAADTRLPSPESGSLTPAVREALADLFEAHAALGQALCQDDEPAVLLVNDIPGMTDQLLRSVPRHGADSGGSTAGA